MMKSKYGKHEAILIHMTFKSMPYIALKKITFPEMQISDWHCAKRSVYFSPFKISSYLKCLNQLFMWFLDLYLLQWSWFKDFLASLNNHQINKTILWSLLKNWCMRLLVRTSADCVYNSIAVVIVVTMDCVGVLTTWEICYFLLSCYWWRSWKILKFPLPVFPLYSLKNF